MGDFVVGRIVLEEDGTRSIEPLDSKKNTYPELALHHQEVMAALIAAAYAYKGKPTAENLVKLATAASQLAD